MEQFLYLRTLTLLVVESDPMFEQWSKLTEKKFARFLMYINGPYVERTQGTMTETFLQKAATLAGAELSKILFQSTFGSDIDLLLLTRIVHTVYAPQQGA